MLYLDYAATTPPYEEVIAAVTEVMSRYYGNPSSIHGLGFQADKLLQESKEVIAAAIGVSSGEIICTSCGTESNNLAIKGTAYQYRQRGNHLITTQIEHPSVRETFRQLEESGFRVTYLPVDAAGTVSLEALREAVCDETILVSVMHVNNEIGTIQPIAEIGKYLAGFPKIVFHVDAVQGIAKLPFKPRELGVDLCSASAHKFRGPKGAGFLYCREGLKLQPLLAGGGQERGFRSGTENVPLIVGMAKALRLSMERLEQKTAHCYELRSRIAGAIAAIPELALSGSADPEAMAPHIVHFAFPGMKAEVVVHALEQRRIYISTKSACASGQEEPSQVMLATGCGREKALSGLRISYGAELTAAEADRCIAELQAVVKQLTPTIKRRVSGRGRR